VDKAKPSSITRLQEIVNSGEFFTDISSEAMTALESSIDIKNKRSKTLTHKEKLTLDFTEINKIAIEKRGNLKVYENLPKGIRVVAR